MAYRPNVTDKEQSDIEQAASDGAIRIHWFDGKKGQEGETKAVKSYDLQAQGDTTGSPNDAVLANNRAQMTIGSHNDKPYRFATPGKA